jgi:hypothetical protein
VIGKHEKPMICIPLPALRPDGGRLRSAVRALAIAGLLAAVACDDAPPEPQPVPGDLDVTLVSPNGSEGAAVLETADEGVTEISVEEGLQAFHWTEGGLTRIVLLLDDVGELRFRMSVTDVNRPPRLDLVEVSDAMNRLRTSLAGYEIAVEPVEGA